VIFFRTSYVIAFFIFVLFSFIFSDVRVQLKLGISQFLAHVISYIVIVVWCHTNI